MVKITEVKDIGKKKRLTYQEFKEMEDYHSTGNLFKCCNKCATFYRPYLKTYKKSGWRVRKITGNWFASKYCNICLSLIALDRKLYKQKVIEKVKSLI